MVDASTVIANCCVSSLVAQLKVLNTCDIFLTYEVQGNAFEVRLLMQDRDGASTSGTEYHITFKCVNYVLERMYNGVMNLSHISVLQKVGSS